MEEKKEQKSISDKEIYKLNNELAIIKVADSIKVIDNSDSKPIFTFSKYKNDMYSVEDLFQDGVIGLIRSLGTYDPNKSGFITHAYFWVKAEMAMQTSQSTSDFNVSENFNDKVRKFNKLQQSSQYDDYVEFTDEELKEFGLTKLDIENIEKYSRDSCVSIDSLSEAGTSSTILDKESPDNLDEIVIHNELKDKFETEMKARLKPFEVTVIKKNFGIGTIPMTLTAIAEEYGVSRQYISKLKSTALDKLKQCTDLKHYK